MTSAESSIDGFRRVGETDVDGRRRISLGRVGSSDHTRYDVYENDLGEILLVPLVSIPAREMIVWQNPQVRESLLRGMELASLGKVVDRGSFAKYADDDVDD